MAGISLNKLNAEVDERYGPFVVEDVPGGEVLLRNAMRLPKAARDKLRKLQKDVTKLKADIAGDDDAADAVEEAVVKMLRDMFRILAPEPADGDRLADEIGDDPAKLMLLMEMYAEDTQLGEALRSAS